MISRWIFRLMPWWLFGLIAIALLPLLVALGQDHLRLRDEISRARSQLPILETLAAGGAVPGTGWLLGEFQVQGVVAAIGDFQHGKSRKVWVLIAPPGGIGTHLVLVVPATKGDYLKSWLSGSAGDDGMVRVSGFRDESLMSRSDISENMDVTGPVGVGEPYFGPRDGALDYKLNWSLAVPCFVAVMVLLAGGMSVRRFRAWRARVRQRQITTRPERVAKPQPAAQPWSSGAKGNGATRTPRITAPKPVARASASSPVTSTVKDRDRFRTSPIESDPKRIWHWFSR